MSDAGVSTAAECELPEPTPTLSKNAQKKLLKANRQAALKLERRAREKLARKEKRKEIAQKKAAGEEVDETHRRKRLKRNTEIQVFDARVVIDLGFDDLMSEKEVASLCSQLEYTYSTIRRTTRPFAGLIMASLGGKALTRLESVGEASYKRWSGVEWWDTGYEQLWSEPLPTVQDYRCSKDSVVYLSADSGQELAELVEGEAYVIGGICDHNRYKNLCENKAKANGVRTARLPIGKFIANLPTRKVLTVNQVFDILQHWVETRDWEDAFYKVIPRRKFQADKGEEPSLKAEVEQEQPDVELQELDETRGD